MQLHYRLIRSTFLATALLLSAMSTQADLKAMGYARYSGLSEDLFLTSLFVDSAMTDTQSVDAHKNAKQLEFKFLGSQLSFRRFRQLLLQSSAINNPPELMKKNTAAINEFVENTKIKGGLQRGDHLVFKSDENGLTTTLNSVVLSVVASPDLFAMFLNSWVGKIPPSREFKDALLGETRNYEVEIAFGDLTYSDSRLEEISLSHSPETVEKKEQVHIEKPKLEIEIEEEKPAPQFASAPVVKANRQSAETVAKDVKSDLPRTSDVISKISPESLDSDEAIFAIAAAKPKDIEPKQIEIKQTLASIDDKPNSIFVDSEFEEARKSRDEFSRTLYVHASKKIFYPKRSRQLRQTGKVLAQVTITRDGKLLDVLLENKSEHDSLNRAVQKALKKSQPYPSVPDAIDGDSFIFEVPVTFSL